MFKRSNFKKTLISVLALVMILSTVAVAANNVYTKDIKATLGRIKINVDGKDVTGEIEKKYGSPAFVVEEYNNRSYLPVRAIAELMGLEIVYDDITHTAHITDKKLKEKDDEIAKLEKEIKDLKKNVVEKSDLESLEKDINKKYGKYKDVNFDIFLRETSSNNIVVDMEVDFRYSVDENYWNRMGSNDRKYMIEGITDMISSKFPNADITGSIYDHYDDKNILTFSKPNNGKVSTSDRGTSSSSSDTWRSLENLVIDGFYDKRIDDAEIVYFSTGSYNVDMDIEFTDRYKKEWKDLNKKDVEYILDKVSDEIVDEYYYDYRDSDNIKIYVYMDNDRQGEYTRKFGDNSENLSIDKNLYLLWIEISVGDFLSIIILAKQLRIQSMVQDSGLGQEPFFYITIKDSYIEIEVIS